MKSSMKSANPVSWIYEKLMAMYGPQGWWPLINRRTLKSEYHKGAPRNRRDVFEVCVGAILTQNTSWGNAEKALSGLIRERLLEPACIMMVKDPRLAATIRHSGYFNQKARKLKEFSLFYLGLEGRVPSREYLLSIWGIGPETADSMLLYAFGVPEFVVDRYTYRIMLNLGLCREGCGYEELKSVFTEALAPDVAVYREYHALLVEHAKRHYMGRGGFREGPLAKAIAAGRVRKKP